MRRPRRRHLAGKRGLWPERDLEQGSLAVIILMGLVLLAIGIGTLAEMLSAVGSP